MCQPLVREFKAGPDLSNLEAMDNTNNNIINMEVEPVKTAFEVTWWEQLFNSGDISYKYRQREFLLFQKMFCVVLNVICLFLFIGVLAI